MKMKISGKRSLLIAIAILQCQFWIVLSRDGFGAVNANDSEDDGNSPTGEGPKNVLDEGTSQSSSPIFISSSFLTIDTSSGLAVDMDSIAHSTQYPFTPAVKVLVDANDSEDDASLLTGERPKNVQEEGTPQSSSPIFISSSFLIDVTPPGLAVGMDSISHSIQYQFTPGTAVLVDADSTSLLKTSIQASFTDETLSHNNYLSESYLVDVPSSYLLSSSYSSDSYNSSENPFYLLDNSSSHVSDINEYHLLSSSSKPQVISLYSSYIYQSLPVKEEDVPPTVISENIKRTPIAESLTMTTSYIASSGLSTDDKNWRSVDDSLYRGKEIQASSTNDYPLQNTHIKESYPINEKTPTLKENGATISLSEEVNTDFRNFSIETRSTTTVYTFRDDSTALSSQIVSNDEILKESNSELMPPSVLTTLEEEINVSNKSYSHEIITDDSSLNNKTSRNEDAEIDDIISGIIHLLAGNVQVSRPTNKGFGFNPTRLPIPLQPSLVSTRINNRGPIRPNSISRTVVVFSQPPNKGHPTELALPGHFVPSTLQNPPFIRIRPTKVGEQPPSAVSVIHFYKQGPKPPVNPPSPNIPFRGEVFNPNPKLNNNVRITAFPNENVRPSFLNPEQQNVFNGNPQNKYPHFIFSDQPASSVVVIHPSKPPSTETFEKFSSGLQKKENVNNKTSPSPSFEVLIDDTMKKKVYVSQAATPSNSYNGFRVKEASDNPKPIGHITATASEDDMPHGPITDWVPFAERPSAKDTLNETSSLAADRNISIIMHPVIFDITVSTSVKEELPSVVTEVTTPNTEQSSLPPETMESSSVSKTEHYELSSSVITEEYSNSNDTLPENINVLNSPRQVSEMPSVSSIPLETSGISSTPTLNAAQINDYHNPQTTMNSSGINMRSSYNKDIKSSVTEKRAFVEHTESAAFPIKSFNSTPTSPQKSKTAEEVTGRPFVIPVDIEDVRPFVGPINPPGFERNRNNSNPGSFPGFQRGKPEDSVRKTTTSTTRVPIIRSPSRPRPTNIRIDTCIVGDDNTCDVTFNETCKTENGISSCHCRPGYSRSFSRGPCVPIVSLMLSMKIDRIGNRKVTFNSRYKDQNSDDYKIMEFETRQALSSLISQIPAFSRTFQGMRINTFYPIGEKLVVNSTIYLEQKESTRTQAIRMRLRQLIGEAVKNRKQNIGDSRLYVDGPFNPITAIEDVNECSDPNLNDCSAEGICFNVFGTYLCKCKQGFIDPFVHDERRSGRKCSACSSEYCSFHGRCFVERHKRYCKCHGNYIGSRCEVDGEVLGVAVGASVAAILIILVTLGCLVIWNRRWKRKQQKTEALSSRSYNSNQTFSYMGTMMNSNSNPYHLTMEDRMRWAHISDVIKVQPNQMLPRLSPLSAGLDQTAFSNRCPATEEDLSWYECRSRPRSRAMKPYGGMSVPSCFEMDISSGGSHYGGPNTHTSKRSLPKRPVSRY